MEIQCISILVSLLFLSNIQVISTGLIDKRRTALRICADYTNADSMPSNNPISDGEEMSYEDGINSDYSIEFNSTTLKNGQVQCRKHSEYCYSVWTLESNGTKQIKKQGCWELADQSKMCDSDKCISGTPHSSRTKHFFCCCSGNLCNQNVFQVNATDEGSTSINTNPEYSDKSMQNLNKLILWIFLLAVITVSLLAYMLYSWLMHKKPVVESPQPFVGGPGYSSNMYTVDNLKMSSMIGQGKYGTVWEGILNEQHVAVKIFPNQHKANFINEREIYSLPFMNDPSILQYFGSDERFTMDDTTEYLLVLELAPKGCLQDYLMEHSLTFVEFCKMAKSICRGLSHLHTEIRNGDKIKPCISHRDFNSRNILVKADLTCCISDFGFSLKTFGPRYEYRGEIALAETKSINEVGTLRYMAPEILEGAVNLRDCESALKQIDVYSLGLVLWELCMRCNDWYPQESAVPPYKTPYEEEVGRSPTYEQMQVLVSKRKARPLFPTAWGGGMGAKLARETCEDCWDHDAEARLTALCAEERINEISSMNNKLQFSKDLPTISTNRLISHNTKPNKDQNGGLTQTLLSKNDIGSSVFSPPNACIQDYPIKNCEMYGRQIHPFQGANPCKERNLNRKNGTDDKFDELDTSITVEHNDSEDAFLNLRNEGWQGVRTLIQNRLFKRYSLDGSSQSEEITNLVENSYPTINTHKKTTINQRPKNLELYVSNYSRNGNPKMKLVHNNNECEGQFMNNEKICYPKIRDSNSFPSSTFINLKENNNKLEKNLNESQMRRQRSYEVFSEMFGVKGSTDGLRNPSQRIKTPGDVPASVRKIRASKTLSLYDDRMMSTALQEAGNTL